MRQLVQAALGAPGYLLNDQVRARWGYSIIPLRCTSMCVKMGCHRLCTSSAA